MFGDKGCNDIEEFDGRDKEREWGDGRCEETGYSTAGEVNRQEYPTMGGVEEVGALDKSRKGGRRSQTPGDWRRYYAAVLEDTDRYLRTFVGRSSGRGSSHGAMEYGNSTTIQMRDSTPKADRSATGLSKRRPAVYVWAANKMK